MKNQTVFQKDEINRELLEFLDKSPVSFYAVRNMREMLEAAGAVRLLEGARWELKPGGMYYVTRNESALIAFRIPEKNPAEGTTAADGGTDAEDMPAGFQIIASHCDSPAFKIKSNAQITVEGHYLTLNIEKYGGMICESWFDRPLSAAGRIVVRTQEGVETKLVCIDRDLLIIPHLAIHMNHGINDGYMINVQKDMMPLFAGLGTGGREDPGGTNEDAFLDLIAEEAGVSAGDILDTDLYLYSRVKGTVLGLHKEFLASGHFDDLQCGFASLKGFLAAETGSSIAVHCVYDNEEVGSVSKQGAASTFLADTLRRINSALGGGEEDYRVRIQNSFLLSADNAHAVHPNYAEMSDPTNRPYLNGGIVIKYHANQKYTTDAVSGAIFRELCKAADVPVQTFWNRSDQPGGSTLGNISTSQVAVNSVDIGLPQLAMHSSYEVTGAEDTVRLVKAAAVYYAASIRGSGDGNYRLMLLRRDGSGENGE